MNVLKKIWSKKSIIRSLPYTLYFNFYYLPFKQAIKLPILLYKPNLLKMNGSIEIKAEKVFCGMIRLGYFSVSLFPNNGMVWENYGGECVFNGKCWIGNSSAISIGKNGSLVFGNNFAATAALKIAAYHKIQFGESVLVGWENTFIDTDFHKLTVLKTGKGKKAFAPIVVGNNNWFGYKSVTLKGTTTPDFCTIGCCSLLSKKYKFTTHSVVAGNPISLLAEGIYRNPEDDQINYETL